MRVLRVALATLLLVAFGTAAQAAHIFWVDGNDGEAFENPAGAGNTPAGWGQGGTVLVTTDTEPPGQVREELQSALIPAGGGSARRNIFRAEPGFHDSGEYHWMFYDDMSGFTDETPNKNVRVGLTRPADGTNPATANPRFAAIAVEIGTTANHSRTNYVWHHGFSFGVMTTPRSLGWREMALKWDVVQDIAGPVTRVQYLVDGVVGATRFHTAVFTPTGEWIGAPFGTASPAWVDIIPEPSTFVLLGLACAGLAGVRRRVL